MLIGQLVAVSFAQNLFMAALSVARPGRKLDAKPQGRLLAVPPSPAGVAGPSYLLCVCVLTSLATVALTPFTVGEGTFLPNLLVMHALLLLPLLPFLPAARVPNVTYAHLYLTTSAISLALRIPTYIKLVSSLHLSTFATVGNNALRTLFEHPAQTSIGYDVLFASGSFLVWMVTEYVVKKEKSARGGALLVALILATPCVGVAGTGGLFLAWREGWTDSGEKRTKVA